MADQRNRSLHLIPLAAAQVTGLACGLIGVRWSSAIVPPEVLGIYGLLLSTQQIGSTVTHQGFIKHVQRFWEAQTPARSYLRLLLAAVGRPTLWLAASLAVALLLLHFTTEAPISPAWWLWMLAINLLAVAAQAAHAALQAEERYWAGFWVSAWGSVTRSFLPLGLVMTGGGVLAMLGTGFLAHTLLWALAAGWCLRAAWTRHGSREAAAIEPPERMVSAFMGVGILGWLAVMSPRWFAAHVLSAEAAGFFILAVNLSMIVPAAISLIGQSYSFPPLFAAGRAGADAATLQRLNDRTVAAALLLGQAGLLALAWCGPHLVGLVVDARYAPSMDWLLPTGGATLAAVTGPFFCNVLIACNRQADCMRVTAASAALRVGLVGVAALAGNETAFRIALALLPWPTAALEWWYTRRLLRR